VKHRLGTALVVTITLIVAIRTAWIATDHDVPVSTIGIAAGSIVYTGIGFYTQLTRPRPKVFTCLTPGCGITITATGQDEATKTRLAALATDHTLHGQAVTPR
jgi:hypothetical protein